MTDNREAIPRREVSEADRGSAYKSQLFRDALAQAGVAHKRTRPYTPRTNGVERSRSPNKAERFIQSSIREWAYAQPHLTSNERTQTMQPWINSYNHSRPHSALGGQPPITRLNNVPGLDS